MQTFFIEWQYLHFHISVHFCISPHCLITFQKAKMFFLKFVVATVSDDNKAKWNEMKRKDSKQWNRIGSSRQDKKNKITLDIDPFHFVIVISLETLKTITNTKCHAINGVCIFLEAHVCTNLNIIHCHQYYYSLTYGVHSIFSSSIFSLCFYSFLLFLQNFSICVIVCFIIFFLSQAA